jgi:MFS-type transporter involved in bile tolerance (Atg22 family)
MTEELVFDHPQGSATLAFAGIVIGSAIGNLLGGFLGDWADRINPRYGRAAMGHISVFSGIPLSYILFTQTQGFSFLVFFALCFVTAVMISWAGKGAKEPMMQGAVPPELRSTALAMTTLLESGFAALVAYVAGRLADSIGLTQALIWTVPVPWIACFALYSLFYWAYPRDSARLRAMMAQRAEELET